MRSTAFQRRRAYVASESMVRPWRSLRWVTAATELDHIKPLHQGGTDDDENLQELVH